MRQWQAAAVDVQFNYCILVLFYDTSMGIECANKCGLQGCAKYALIH